MQPAILAANRKSSEKMAALKGMIGRVLRACGVLAPAGSILTSGPGRGLRFQAGASNPGYEIGDNELPVLEAVQQRLPAGGTFVDVGANVGYLSVIAGHLVGRAGLVLAYEPVPGNAALARANAAANGMDQVQVHEIALGERTGPGTLVLAGYSGGSALASVAPPPDACGELGVRVFRLDDHLAILPPLDRLDLIKIDVEGAELQALSGMEQTLARWRPSVVVEVDDAEAPKAAAKRDACRDWLSRRGYQVIELPDSYPGIAWHVHHLVADPVPAGPAVPGAD